MNDIEIRQLNKFYNLLFENLEKDKKLKEKSILISFLKPQKASRFRLLRRSTLSSDLIPNHILSSLLSKRYIQNIDEIELYAITGRGVWFIEKSKELLNKNILISYIDDEYFTIKIKDLNDKEKIILFSLISTRTFSENSTVDLNKDIPVKNRWKHVMERCYDKLNDLKIIKIEKDKLFKRTGNMHIVSYIFRHNNDMVQRTKEIYSYNRKQEYYLDLFSNSYFSDEKLSYLFWKIFKGSITADVGVDIINFCNDISKQESIYLFEGGKHIFTMPSYDLKIKDGLFDSIINKEKWDKIS